VKMLLGSDKNDNWLVEKRVTDVVVVPSIGLLTVSLRKLLTMEDPEIEVYIMKVGSCLRVTSFPAVARFCIVPLCLDVL
jgi:hypothetical protein